MAQDLRNLFEKDPEEQHIKMSDGHEARFLQKLENKLPKTPHKNRFNFLNIAASIIVILGFSYGVYYVFPANEGVINATEVVNTDLKTLGDVSPDLKKIEDYYLASINLQLSRVKLTPENKELFDGYVLRLKELNEEYNRLTQELNTNGPHTETLDALIDNLKFRLNLVMRLKEKLQAFNDDTFAQDII
ncbi:hypothetical protein OAA67_03790 [Winogradskyella sp.]|nr:hypothetical protein [Winogradskyella sp.]MDC0006407.1 hypothetical protein [Winogradskyella sp.]